MTQQSDRPWHKPGKWLVNPAYWEDEAKAARPFFTGIPPVISEIRNGTLRALGVTTASAATRCPTCLPSRIRRQRVGNTPKVRRFHPRRDGQVGEGGEGIGREGRMTRVSAPVTKRSRSNQILCNQE